MRDEPVATDGRCRPGCARFRARTPRPAAGRPAIRLIETTKRFAGAPRPAVDLVTHDIDEAIKVADRIALLNVGGILEQYAPPDEVLAAPANDFVERFVGQDRSAKSLTLANVEDLPFEQGPVVESGRLAVAHPPAARRRRFGTGVWGSSYAALVPMGLYEPPWTYPPAQLALDASYHEVYGVSVALAWRLLGGR